MRQHFENKVKSKKKNKDTMADNNMVDYFSL